MWGASGQGDSVKETPQGDSQGDSVKETPKETHKETTGRLRQGDSVKETCQGDSVNGSQFSSAWPSQHSLDWRICRCRYGRSPHTDSAAVGIVSIFNATHNSRDLNSIIMRYFMM